MKRTTVEKLLFAALILAAVAPAFANEGKPEGGQALRPCAMVEKFLGDTQILDESRTQVAEADVRTPVQCGGWVSVANGWVILQHRFGYRIHLGPNSFVRFQDDADAIVLYRGQIYAQSGGGMGELRIVTPNARAKVSRSSVVALFDPDEESTQITAVDGKAVLENRFDDSRKASVDVKSGYASILDFKLLRVVPSVPKIVATSSLKAKLKELNVPERQTERALAIARNRQNELFASFEKSQSDNLAAATGKNAHGEVVSARKPASEPAHGSQPMSYKEIHEKGVADSNDYLLRKTVGGTEDGMRILKPTAKKRHHAPQEAKVQVEDPEAQLLAKQKSSEDREKKRLIEELSKIHAE